MHFEKEVGESLTYKFAQAAGEMKAQGKRFLLIDDEAEKGWEFALKHYLRASSKFETYAFSSSPSETA